MHNYRRALKDALQFWPSIAIATACSIIVAFLWGANIGAFYPILNVTFKGKSVQAWVAEEIEKGNAKLTILQDELEELNQQVAAAANPDPALLKRIDVLELDKINQQSEIDTYVDWWQPWVGWLPHSPFSTVAAIVGILMATTLIRHVFLVTNELLIGRVAIDISRSIRLRIFQKALELDRATYSSIGTSTFTTHLTQTGEMLSQGLINTLGGAVREPLKIISCLVVAATISWRLLLISLFIAPAVGVVLYGITRRLKRVAQRVLSKATSFQEVMLESFNNLQTVQAYAMEQAEQNRFARATLDMRTFGLKFILYTALAKPVIEVLGLGMLCTTIVGGAYLILNHETHLLGIPVCDQPLTLPAMFIFFGALIGASDPLRKMSMVYSSIYAGTIAADALYPLLDRAAHIRDPEHPRTLPNPRHRTLRLEKVSFGYRPDQSILKDVSLEIPFGSTVALVGHNGSGKSTLVNLLCRFYDPTNGTLTLDGIDLRQMRLHDIRQRMAIVSQHTELFNESIRYNIAYGTADANDAMIVAAAKQAHAHEFIMRIGPDGYTSRVGQGGQRLSGGQRQRIALARALLRDPEILILDEATSQIDMHSEQLIRESLSHHRGKRTMIIITHREALLALADHVYEVKDGQLHLIDRGHPCAA